MTLKIFTPAQSRSAGEEREAKDAMRAKSLADTTKELLDMRNQAEKEFEESMKRQQELAEKWYTDNTARKKLLEKEVEQLEERRRNALKAPLLTAEEIQTTEQELWSRKLQMDKKEVDFEESLRLLMKKMDEISTKQQDLDDRERKIKVKELGTEDQRNQVAQSAKKLNMQVSGFLAEKNKSEIDFALRASELDAEKNLISEKEKNLAEREKELESAKTLLHIGQDTLKNDKISQEKYFEKREEEVGKKEVKSKQDFLEREEEIEKRLQQVKTDEKQYEPRKKELTASFDQLTEEIEDFARKVQDKESEFSFRDSELKARKNLYDQNDRLLIAREKEIESAKIQLADQRLLLEKGFFELRKKQK